MLSLDDLEFSWVFSRLKREKAHGNFLVYLENCQIFVTGFRQSDSLSTHLIIAAGGYACWGFALMAWVENNRAPHPLWHSCAPLAGADDGRQHDAGGQSGGVGYQ